MNNEKVEMNNTEHLISIVIPVYNVEKYLGRCMDSILSQTYKYYEIILIDDGSSDNSPQICEDYANRLNNITVLHLESSGRGVSDARNAGIKLAKGKYITFIDSDDIVHFSLLEILINALEINNVKLSMCSYQKVNLNESDLEPLDDKRPEVIIIDDSEAMNMLIDDQSYSASWGKLFDATLFENVEYPSGQYNEDMMITPILLRKAKTIAYSSQKLYYYCQDAPSLVRTAFNYNKLEVILAVRFWKEHAVLYYPGLVEKTRSHYYLALISICQYIANKKDELGHRKYSEITKEIKDNYSYIRNSEYTSKTNQIKLSLIKSGLFRPVFRIIEFLNIRKYDVGF